MGKSLVETKTVIENWESQASSTLSFLFSKKPLDKEKLKKLHELMKSLPSILSLALTTHQLQKSGGKKEEEIDEFKATRFLKNEESKKFWALHFGNSAFEVAWERFSAAFIHEYGQIGGLDLQMLKRALDANQSEKVSVYKLSSFTSENSLKQSFELLKEKTKKEKTFTKPSPRSKKRVIQESRSLASKKSKTEESEKSSFKLELFGEESILEKAKKSEFCLLKEYTWKLNGAYPFGREKFSDIKGLSESLLTSISRKHFYIKCVGKEEERQFELVSQSANGTFLNSEKLGPNERRLMNNGDSIAIIMNDQSVIIGFKFSTM